MVRTKADRAPTKAVGGKAPAKFSRNASSKKSNSVKVKSYAGGNPYHPRETPGWQKPITSFMNTSSTTKIADNDASTTSSKEDQHEDVEESEGEIDESD